MCHFSILVYNKCKIYFNYIRNIHVYFVFKIIIEVFIKVYGFLGYIYINKICWELIT